VFSIAEVNALIPTISVLVAQQLREQSEIEQGLAELARRTGRPPRSLVQASDDPGDITRIKRDLRERVRRYEAGWERVQELGGVVKDPQTGLVDFYGRIDGKTVWLCWRYGEKEVAFWHDLESGFAGRRPVSELQGSSAP